MCTTSKVRYPKSWNCRWPARCIESAATVAALPDTRPRTQPAPLVSSLKISGDSDNTAIRYQHRHVVSDALSLFENGARPAQKSETVLTYDGFVFNADRRAIFLSTSLSTAHAKQMVLRIPANGSLRDASIRGLVLTVSADEREPFAARVVMQRLPKKLTDEEEAFWEPGLKAWDELPPMVRREFDEQGNFGLMHLHA
jgi:hypothetical protein